MQLTQASHIHAKSLKRSPYLQINTSNLLSSCWLNKIKVACTHENNWKIMRYLNMAQRFMSSKNFINIQLIDFDIKIDKQLSKKKRNLLMRLYLEKNKIKSDKIVSIFVQNVVNPSVNSTLNDNSRQNQGNLSVDIPISSLMQRYLCDVRYLGVIFFQLLTGINPISYLQSIQDGVNPKIRFNCNTNNILVSASGLKFMRDCLIFNPEKKNGKGSMQSIILNHEFFGKSSSENQNAQLYRQNSALSKISFQKLLKLFKKYFRIGQKLKMEISDFDDQGSLPNSVDRKITPNKSKSQEPSLFNISTEDDVDKAKEVNSDELNQNNNQNQLDNGTKRSSELQADERSLIINYCKLQMYLKNPTSLMIQNAYLKMMIARQSQQKYRTLTEPIRIIDYKPLLLINSTNIVNQGFVKMIPKAFERYFLQNQIYNL
ncbi:UNKNOWN [Stylonychia lemnae]|uniref:Uncharacterized protein n=1 Tax=Stylonychia lemnae TaxID=5949 RepID=A0A078BBF3_STYLE|nr:UNKNOWN [Stylonychia lemnae]|eukprot:CDW90597.1 UNKNOWN [Stylonychia lemnae]